VAESNSESDKVSGFTEEDNEDEFVDADDGLGLINTMAPTTRPAPNLAIQGGDSETLKAGQSDEDQFSSPVHSPLIPIG